MMFDILATQQEPNEQKKVKNPQNKKDSKKIEESRLPVGLKEHEDPCTPSSEDSPKKPQEPRPNDEPVAPNSEKVPAVNNDEIKKKEQYKNALACRRSEGSCSVRVDMLF